jgi:hypothetical protein
MNREKLIYIAVLLLIIFLALKIVRVIFPFLLFIAIFVGVYALVSPEFKTKVTGILQALKEKFF